MRSFINASDGVTASATGTSLKPVESTAFDDMRIVADFQAAGRHRLVGGAALTWGRTTAEGNGFDFDLTIGPNPVVPELGSVPVGDHRSFSDRRTFFGFYLNDEWTPRPFPGLRSRPVRGTTRRPRRSRPLGRKWEGRP